MRVGSKQSHIVRFSGTRFSSNLRLRQAYRDKDSEGGVFNTRELTALEAKGTETTSGRQRVLTRRRPRLLLANGAAVATYGRPLWRTPFAEAGSKSGTPARATTCCL